MKGADTFLRLSLLTVLGCSGSPVQPTPENSDLRRLLASLHAPWPGGPNKDRPEAVLPSESVGKPARGLEWRVIMTRSFTLFDPIEVQDRLTNVSGQPIQWETDGQVRYPDVVLTGEGGPSLTHTLRTDTPGYRGASASIHPRNGETLLGHTFEVRGLFGRLKPGTYDLRLFYPASRFGTLDLLDSKPCDLESPSIRFTVHDTSVKEAERSNPKHAQVRVVPGEPFLERGYWELYRPATVTNGGASTIIFAASRDSTTGWLSPRLTWEKWCGPHGWVQAETFLYNDCSGAWMYPGAHILAPGQSSLITLYPLADGIYRYRLRFGHYEPQSEELQIAHSQSLLIDRFDLESRIERVRAAVENGRDPHAILEEAFPEMVPSEIRLWVERGLRAMGLGPDR